MEIEVEGVQSNLDFDYPPVRETAMGFEFPNSRLSTRHLVAVHDALAGGYDRFEERAPIPRVPEVSGPFVLSDTYDPPRLWLIDDSSGRLLQLQSDRLMLNWRGWGADVKYPRFPALLALFTDSWRVACGTARDRGTELVPTCAEFTYVNEVDDSDGLVWTDALTFNYNGQPRLPGADGHMAFQMTRRILDDGEERGTVVVNAQKVASGSSSMAITSRVGIDPDQMDPFAALRLAHDLSRDMFYGLTTEAGHRRWGITR